MDKQSIENNLNDEQELPKYWIDRLSDENKILEKRYSKTHCQNIAQPTHIASIADFNEAIRKFASSFLLPKTDVSFYRMMLTYLGTPIGIDIRMSNHPAGKDENWLLTEGNGLANQRLSIYFRGDTNAISKDCDDGVPLIEQGFHYEHLKNEHVLNEIRKSIVGFIKNGSYVEIKQPFIESDADVAERLRKKEIEKNNRKVQRKFAGISPEDAQSTDNNKTDKNESKNMNRKNTIRLTESDLKKVISESVKRVLKENDIENRISSLKNMSKTYMGDEMGNKTKLDKTWNRGMGRQSFIEILPDEGVILYNTLLTNKRDIERIKQVFPEYEVVPVDKPYHSLSSLKTHRQNTLGENRVIKENYNPVSEGIMNFHSDMNALRSDIDEILGSLPYDEARTMRLRTIDKKLAQIGAEFAKIESTLEFLGNQN